MKHPFLRSLIKRIIVLSVSVHTIVISIVTAFVLVGLLFAGAWSGDTTESLQYQTVEGKKTSNNKILSVKVSGIILGDESGYPSSFPFLSEGITFGYDVKNELAQAAKDSDIKAVIVEINSPGGTIYGSRAIADGISEYKKATGNPVYAYVAGLAASGGYMAAVTADSIYADHGSTTGSIGVVFGPIKYYDTVLSEGGLLEGEVMTQNGIESIYITAGKSKDLGNPYRRLTTEERTSLQAMVNSEYDSFVSFVSDHRKISQTVLRDSIGALIYSNNVAQETGLIDGTQNKQQAYSALAQQAGITDFKVIEKVRSYGLVESLLEGKLMRSQVGSSCFTTQGILAYHGDLSALCGSTYSK
ncbi:MAG TPA: S49 family peptidase [Candidatus Levybacteria bacterium]|nr:S49 family peptidase [Candidatus Levybacteria bacterium]